MSETKCCVFVSLTNRLGYGRERQFLDEYEQVDGKFTKAEREKDSEW